MIIFESILTTFEASVIFEAAGAVAKIYLSLKPDHQRQIYLAQISETLCMTKEGSHESKKVEKHWYKNLSYSDLRSDGCGLPVKRI